MARWLIHLKDGKTLTDEDCFPHEIDVMKKLGYSPDDITSVERIVKGRHLSIAKSPFIDTFFVGTEAGIDMKMSPGKQLPPQETKKILGCYIKDAEPPLQIRLVMDPRTFDTRLELLRVKKKTLRGINAKLVNPPKKGALREEVTKEYVYGNRYTIEKTSDIKSVFKTPLGFAAHLRKPKLRLEMVIRSQNVLFGVTQTGQKLKVEFLAPENSP